MKSIPVFYFSLLLFTMLSCKDAVQKVFIFNPTISKEYQFTLTSKIYNLHTEVTCDFQKEKDSIVMVTTIVKMDNLDPSEQDPKTDYTYQHLIGTTMLSSYTTYGKSFIEENSSDRILNPDLFIVEFPKKAIKVGDTWEGVKSAKPDLFFSTIHTTYTLNKIDTNNNAIAVKMIAGPKQTGDAISRKLTRNYIGTYIVNDDGTVKSATLELTVHDGFTTTRAQITIK